MIPPSAPFTIDEDGDLRLETGAGNVYVTGENLPALLALLKDYLDENEDAWNEGEPVPPVPPEPVLRPPALAICSCCEGIGVAEQVLGLKGWKVRCSFELCDIRTKDHRTRYEAHVAWNEGEKA